MDITLFFEKQKLSVDVDRKHVFYQIWKEIDDMILKSKAEFMLNFENNKNYFQYLENNFVNYKFDLENRKKNALTISAYYAELKYFPSEQIFEKLKILGFAKKDFIFFIPISNILNEMDSINCTESVKISYANTFKLLEIHFSLKIIDLVQKKLDMVGPKKSGTVYNEAHNLMFDFYRNFANNKNTPESKFWKNQKNQLFLELVENFNLDGKSNNETRKNVLYNFQGKTEKDIIKEIIDSCVYYKCGESEMYRTIFNFCKLILPDSSLLTEDEFMESAHSASYDANYGRYQYIKLKSLLKTTIQ